MYRPKDAYYFAHDSNAKDDPKCVLLIEQLGLEGYGIFWVLIETLREQANYRYPLALLPALARRFNTTHDKMKVVVHGYNLFAVEDNEFFFSHALRRRMERLDHKREQARIAGTASAEKRMLPTTSSTNSERTFNDRSTTVQRPFNEGATNVQRTLSDRSTTVQRPFNQHNILDQNILDQNIRESAREGDPLLAADDEDAVGEAAEGNGRSAARPPVSGNNTIAPEGESEAGVQAHRFATFWLAYPRKAAKQEAERAWKKIRADDVLLNKILGALEAAKNSRQWQRDAGQFIPHPATWLNQRRWEDESDSKTVPVEVAQPREPDFYEEYEQREARLRAERAPDTDEERAEMPLRFEEFWDVYPKKIAKEDALKAWLKLHPGADLRAHMMAVVIRHARKYPNDHLIARGAVWINGRLWESERWLAQAREG